MFDYHLHTHLCGHAQGKVSDYAAQAVRLGYREICFTDHIPLPNDYDSFHRMAMGEIDLYLDEIERAREMYPEINILTGIEADYIEGFEEFTTDFLARYPFDLVLMSVHFVSGWPEGDWVFNYHFPEKSLKQIYREYFLSMIQGIKTGLYDVVAHIDLIKIPGNPVLETNRDDIDSVLTAVKKAGMAIEINTSGLHKSIAEPYPALDLARMIVQAQIPVTIGSDAHSPEQVGFRFDVVSEFLAAHPSAQLARYRRRKRELMDINLSGF